MVPACGHAPVPSSAVFWPVPVRSGPMVVSSCPAQTPAELRFWSYPQTQCHQPSMTPVTHQSPRHREVLVSHLDQVAYPLPFSKNLRQWCRCPVSSLPAGCLLTPIQEPGTDEASQGWSSHAYAT